MIIRTTHTRLPQLRRLTVTVAAALLATLLLGGQAMAMQPPADAASHRFGCVDGEDNAVAGHPGARGLVDATPKVAALTGNPMPTAWNAVQHAGPIQLGGC
jgi:hypothetical protein